MFTRYSSKQNAVNQNKQIGYIYVFQRADHVRKNIYKIGHTTRTIPQRLKEYQIKYPGETKLIMHFKVYESKKAEAKILKILRKKYLLVEGLEYFQGNLYDILANLKKILRFDMVQTYDTTDNSNLNDQYEVEKIIDKKIKKDKVLYCVKWKHYDESENTWEPIENLENAIKLVLEFEIRGF